MNDRLDELIALAALGELTADETTELDTLLATDAEAASELADALDVAATLQSSEPLEPPPAPGRGVGIDRVDRAGPGEMTSCQISARPHRRPPSPVSLDEARRRRRVSTGWRPRPRWC